VPRAGLDAEAVVAAAAELADAEGLEAVTLARLAARLNVRAPSLYAHVDGGLPDLRRRLAARGAQQLGAALQAAVAGRAGADALTALARVYRAYAREHPGLYAATQRAPDVGEAGGAVVDTVVAVLRGYGLEGDEAVHATRVVRAALHGFAALETGEGFGIPLAVDASFDRLIAVLDRGLSRR
jgi:AcrR family transcriptional regulator